MKKCLLLLFWGFTWQNAFAAQNSSVLTISVYTVDGTILEDATTILTETGTGKVVSVSNVRYGQYKVTIRRPGFKTYEREVKVYQPLTYIRATLPVGGADSGSIGHLKGRFTRTAAVQEDFWCKLVPLTNTADNTMETLVDAEGRFEFAGMDSGEYVVMIVAGQRIIASQQVYAPSQETVTIRVP